MTGERLAALELEHRLALVEKQRDKLRAVIREAYEAWCGSELAQNPVALTATEAYTHKVLNDVLEPIRRALK